MVATPRIGSVLRNACSSFNLPRLVIAGLSVGFVLTVVPNLVAAQTKNNGPVNPLQDFQKRDNFDPFSSNGNSGITPGFFELIHKATQGFGNNDAAAEQGQALDSAALDFRKQQQQRIQGTGATATGSPAPTPPTAPAPVPTTP